MNRVVSRYVDALGQRLTCASAEALAAYDRAVDHQLHAWPGGLDALDAALQLDPDFALAHSTRALVLQSQGRGPEARAAVQRARECSVRSSDREQAHIGAIGHAVEGRASAALAAVLAHAEHWPADALVLSMALGAFGLIALSGAADHDQQRLALVRQIAPHYAEDNPWMLAHRSWSLTEAGSPDAGLPLVQRSLALRRANGNAAHVLMHAHFERAEPEAALRFVDDWLQQYPANAMLFGHLHWHAALCEIELGDIDAAVARLLGRITPHLQDALPLVGMTDTASLLWRLRLQGRSGWSWQAARAYAAARFPSGGNVFAELHLAMLAAGTGDASALRAGYERLQRQADAGHAGAPVAMQWVTGLQALLEGDLDAARSGLAACCAEAPRLGGSHAQRTVVDLTLAHATAA